MERDPIRPEMICCSGLYAASLRTHPRRTRVTIRGMATNLPQLAALPTEEEKSLAMLNYILSIFGWLAPLIIWLVKRDSKFVAFHALQTLIWHGIYTAVAIVGGIFFFMSIFISAAAKQQGDGPGAV